MKKWNHLLIMLSLITFLFLTCCGYAQNADQDIANQIQILKNPTATVDDKGTACERLMDYGPKAKTAVPALIDLLQEREMSLRDYAITTLTTIGPAARTAIPALRRVAAADPSPDIRRLAANAVQQLGGPGEADSDFANPKPSSGDNQTPRNLTPSPMPVPAAEKQPWSNEDRDLSKLLPAGWHSVREPDTGRTVITGTRGEKITIWPLFLAKQQLTVQTAGKLLRSVARQLDSQINWGAPKPCGTGLRVVGRSTAKMGITAILWVSRAEGTLASAYCLQAPPNRYPTAAPQFAAILQKLSRAQSTFGSGTGPHSPVSQVPLNRPLKFVTWWEPNEKSFSLSVPEGWSVSGGLYRTGKLDFCPAVGILSPDGQISITFGDSRFNKFMLPNPYANQKYLPVRAFTTGRQLAQEYVQRCLPEQCPGLTITANRDLPEEACRFQAAYPVKGITPNVTVGEVSFTCRPGGAEACGRYTAITSYLNGEMLWYVIGLYGYLCVATREPEAIQATVKAAASYAVNPQWSSKQSRVTTEVVQQFNAQAEQYRKWIKSFTDTIQYVRDNNETARQNWWQTQEAINEQHINIILGEEDVSDPNTGVTYKVDTSSGYHWVDAAGNVIDSDKDETPDNIKNWTKLVEVR